MHGYRGDIAILCILIILPIEGNQISRMICLDTGRRISAYDGRGRAASGIQTAGMWIQMSVVLQSVMSFHANVLL